MEWYGAIQTFVMVVEQHSFAKAAVALHISNSAVSKRISWLEEQLGAQLLIRSTRQLNLSEIGLRFYEQSKHWLEQFEMMRAQTTETALSFRGTYRVGVPAPAGGNLLTPLLVEMLNAYPKLNIRLINTVGIQLPDPSLDVFISREMLGFDTNSYKALPLFDYATKLYASPSYIAKHALLDNEHSFDSFELLLTETQLQMGGIKLNSGRVLNKASRLVCDTPESSIQAAILGFGIVVVSQDMVIDALQRKQLQLIFPHLESERRRVYAYYPNLKYVNPVTQDFLTRIRQVSFPQFGSDLKSNID